MFLVLVLFSFVLFIYLGFVVVCFVVFCVVYNMCWLIFYVLRKNKTKKIVVAHMTSAIEIFV